jgi:hypothetical protein
MTSLFWADALLLLHLAFILAVILPVPLIVIGSVRKWRWVRHRAFRLTHLVMILFVALESLFGYMCPLTLWENSLRLEAGDNGYDASFIAYWVSRMIYLDLPSWVFTATYAGFAGLVAVLFLRVPIINEKKL